jgi:hypothetical protein
MIVHGTSIVLISAYLPLSCAMYVIETISGWAARRDRSSRLRQSN